MPNEQATELLALMADQPSATDQLTEAFKRCFTQFGEVVLNGLVRLEDKFDKKTSLLAEEIRGTNGHLGATFEQAGRLTEETTSQEARLIQPENEAPSTAEPHRRVPAPEEQRRHAF